MQVSIKKTTTISWIDTRKGDIDITRRIIYFYLYLRNDLCQLQNIELNRNFQVDLIKDYSIKKNVILIYKINIIETKQKKN